MRKENLYGMPRDQAIALLARAPTVVVASTDPDGAPVLRELNAACHDGRIWFHGAPVGEKTLTFGRPCVVAASETVAEIPSYWSDPERACPATTLFRSVQVHGVLEPARDRATKASALAALMAKQQPEGRHAPLDHPLYAKELDGLAVFSVALERVDGKAKLAQNRDARGRAAILQGLWRRGRPGDARAIDLIAQANGDPLAFLPSPAGTRWVLAPSEAHARSVAELLAPTYWCEGLPREEIVEAHLRSTAWLLLEDALGVAASARACSDVRRRAWIYDVIVREDLRGQGHGDAVTRALLDHAAVRDARFVHLSTRDAAGFYARLGFRETSTLPPRPWPVIQMVKTIDP
jgi:predicted FMN-binding regulatory protein PaiB/N-acetylglutamate synthase-like GNAT family acetyltransferase